MSLETEITRKFSSQSPVIVKFLYAYNILE